MHCSNSVATLNRSSSTIKHLLVHTCVHRGRERARGGGGSGGEGG